MGVSRDEMINDLYMALVGSESVDLSRKQLKVVIDTFFGLVEKQLLAHNKLRLGNIGTLRTVRRKARKFRVPKISQTVLVPEHDKVQITNFKGFVKLLNQK